MNQKKVLQKARQYIKKNFVAEPTGHDFYHMERVARISLYIAKKEKQGNLFFIELAALLHDLEDSKFNKNSEQLLKTKSLLKKWGLSEENTLTVLQIIRSVSFKKGKNKHTASSFEAEVVQDADRLDALGAIGIARCFAYGGKMQRPIYEPENLSSQNSLKHFYDKLLLLKSLMKTRTGKKIAFERHEFLKKFLNQFFKEWNFKV